MPEQSSTELDNPLIWPILTMLESTRKSWKVHHLMSALQENHVLNPLDSDYQTDLFKRNFMIMNALYQLQTLLYPNQWLQVEAMDICVFSYVSRDNEIKHKDSLREYYLDWKNYNAPYKTIRDLMQSFWRRYQSHIGEKSFIKVERKSALEILELPPNADAIQIRHQWRKLALKWHPDRPKGNADKFKEICKAWESLR